MEIRELISIKVSVDNAAKPFIHRLSPILPEPANKTRNTGERRSEESANACLNMFLRNGVVFGGIKASYMRRVGDGTRNKLSRCVSTRCAN